MAPCNFTPGNKIGPNDGPAAPRRARCREGAGPHPSTARTELIAIQRGIVDRMKVEIDASLGPSTPAIDVYHEEYWREVSAFEAISSWEELADACAGASIVYVGDYHTLRASQETAAALADALLVRGRDVVLALEMVPAAHQDALDRFMAREIGEDSFRRAIDFERAWGFPWEPYRRLLAFARLEGLRVVGINSEPPESAVRLIERDFGAARVIVRETLARPDAVVLVLDGDLHVARDHLPLIVDSELRRAGALRRSVVVHQNAEAIYWRLAERGLERDVDVVRIAPACYCVLSATPLVKLQSYMSWEEAHEEIDAGGRAPCGRRAEEGGGADHAERVHEIVRTIAGFLEMDPAGLDDFSLYTTSDLGFLGALRESGRFSAREVAEIERRVRASESAYIPKARIIYLADRTLHRAAEEATHFIHAVRSRMALERRDARDAFYVEALSEALGFFGSRIIDPKRTRISEEDLRGLARACGDGGTREERRASGELRRIAALSLAHRVAERRMLDGGRFAVPPGLLLGGQRVVSGTAHILGYALGDRLHAALSDGAVSKAEVRALFEDPLAHGAAEERYLWLVRRLARVERADRAARRGA